MNIHEIHSNCKTKPPSSGTIRQEHGFQRIFAQKMSKIQGTNPTTSHDAGDILEKSEGLLSLLEEYGRELSDPGISLSDIEPLLLRIKEEADSIEAEASEKGHGDKALRRFISELAVTANVTVFKFHRGDYV